MTVRQVDPADFDWSAPAGPAADVRRIAAAADAADGVLNLNEAARLRLKHHGITGSALFLDDDGFALRTGPDVDLVVAPDARGHGVGSALADAAFTADGPLGAGTEARVEARVEAWSHADHPAAVRIAARHALRRTRELWVMRRPLDDTLAALRVPTDYSVRAFRDGDEQDVLAINALAFAHHAEQGSLTLDDFRERQAEDWFDPAGLFLAVEPGGRVLGFHWTKEHRDEAAPFGEVYVVAVDPHAAGRGIGTVLTNTGLRHLRDQGLASVILYVDGDNAPAIAVYQRAGFDRVRVEAQYTR